MQAVYFQKSKVVQEEFKLIELTTLREVVVEKLRAIIGEVKEERRQLDDETMLETFSLFTKVREATVDLIRAISIWQESFTSYIRPTLMECDYVIERLVKDIDFINGSNLRKIFNFQFFRGNVLLLPYPNQKTVPHEKVSTLLAEQIKLFSSPPEEDVIFCYQFLINSLPEDVYKKVVSLKDWLMSAWVPKIWIADVLRGIKKREARGALIAAGKSTSAPKLTINSDENSTNSAEPKVLSPAENKAKILEQLRAKISVGRNLNRSGSTGVNQALQEETNKKARKASVRMVKRLRRNQMLANEAEKLLHMTNAATKEEQERLERLQQKELEEQVASINEEEKEELAKIDLYYREMEKRFIPKAGRRAVQTLAITGLEGRDHEEVDFQFSSPSKMFYLHSTTSLQKLMDKIVNTTDTTETSKRTDGNLIAKRNRLVNDRNAGNKDSNKDYATLGKDLAIGTSETNTDVDVSEVPNEEDEENQSVASAERSVDDSVDGSSSYKGHLTSSALSLNEEDTKKKNVRRLSKASSSRRFSDLTVTFSELGESVKSEDQTEDKKNKTSASTPSKPTTAKDKQSNKSKKQSSSPSSKSENSTKLPSIKRDNSGTSKTSDSGLFNATTSSFGSNNETVISGTSGGQSPSNGSHDTGTGRSGTKAVLDSTHKKKKPFVKASQSMTLFTSEMRDLYLQTTVATTKKNILNLG